jgi:hypothetical protein
MRVSNYLEIAYVLLRVTLSVMFLIYGVRSIATGTQQRFTGILLVLGLFNTIDLILSEPLFLAITLGAVLQSGPSTVAHNVQFALVSSVLLLRTDYNRYSIDQLRRRQAYSE